MPLGWGPANLVVASTGEPLKERANQTNPILVRVVTSAAPQVPLLVGATGSRGPAFEAEMSSIRERITTNGTAANWWSFPLVGEKAEALERNPYLYVYVGQPTQALTHRIHVKDLQSSTGGAGIECPWPEAARPEDVGKTTAGSSPAEVFKTWFLHDEVEVLNDPIPLSELSTPDGTPVNTSSLLNGFAIWTKRKPDQVPSGALAELLGRSNMDRSDIQEIESLLQSKGQIILEGPPGSGKTYVGELIGRYLSDNPLTGSYGENFQIVQFHQSYGYEDFVQGIRPLTRPDGTLEYRVIDGIFRRFAETASKNPEKTFVILIDEINRGNVSRIFGELLLLLEYRDKHVELPYALPTDPPFSIPQNVVIIGTMNTADRSLAQIDYALRRRFYFYRLSPVVQGSAPILERWLSKNVSVPEAQQVLKLFVSLNEKLTGILGEHFQVGHSYFMDPSIGSLRSQAQVWRHAIMPLLEEYFYSRRDMRGVLAEFDLTRLLEEPVAKVGDGTLEDE